MNSDYNFRNTVREFLEVDDLDKDSSIRDFASVLMQARDEANRSVQGREWLDKTYGEDMRSNRKAIGEAIEALYQVADRAAWT